MHVLHLITSVDNILFRKKDPFLFLGGWRVSIFFKRHISVRNESCNTWLAITANLLRAAHSVIYSAVIFFFFWLGLFAGAVSVPFLWSVRVGWLIVFLKKFVIMNWNRLNCCSKKTRNQTKEGGRELFKVMFLFIEDFCFLYYVCGWY